MDEVPQVFENCADGRVDRKMQTLGTMVGRFAPPVEKLSRALPDLNQIEILELTASFVHGSHPGRLRVSAIRGTAGGAACSASRHTDRVSRNRHAIVKCTGREYRIC
jgi:hypothetical protein